MAAIWDFVKPISVMIVMLAILYVLAGLTGQINPVTEELAVIRFAELAQVQPDEIEVVRHSNNSPWLFGDPYDVIFELTIGGTPVSGRCNSSWVSPMICRLYTGGE